MLEIIKIKFYFSQNLKQNKLTKSKEKPTLSIPRAYNSNNESFLSQLCNGIKKEYNSKKFKFILKICFMIYLTIKSIQLSIFISSTKVLIPKEELNKYNSLNNAQEEDIDEYFSSLIEKSKKLAQQEVNNKNEKLK